jgi:hypothetical protein
LAGPVRISPIYHFVVAVNDDTLYASAFGNVAQQPLVVTIPTASVTYSELVAKLGRKGSVQSVAWIESAGVAAAQKNDPVALHKNSADIAKQYKQRTPVYVFLESGACPRSRSHQSSPHISQPRKVA